MLTIKTKIPNIVTILAIESSCDDTSAAILRGWGQNNTFSSENIEILSNCVANQTVHEQYGGVVPELASRAHQVNIVPTVDLALKNKQTKEAEKVSLKKIPALCISPSANLGEIARSQARHLPRLLRLTIGALGDLDDASEIISYLMFDKNFCRIGV